MEASDILRLARKRMGLTQGQVAAYADTSQPVVSAYEHGHREPTLPTLRKLVQACGLDLRIEAQSPVADLPAPRDAAEHGRRLVDVLSLADAIPTRRRPITLVAPRLVSK